MPFYEYQCNNCGHALEAMQKVSDAPLKKCPQCGKPQLQKLMSAPVFRLKGGGWYETDFKSDQDSKRNLADRPEDAPKEDKKEGAAAESKEAPTTDAKSDKPAEKPVEKAGSGESAKKTAARATQGRPVAHKPNARKAAKRPARPATKRPRAKPARGR
jgi:putative FmdB family regulatory protein